MASKHKVKPEPKAAPPAKRPKPSPLPAARSVFTHFGVPFEESPEPMSPWRVAGRFNYWPLSKLWREDDHHPLVSGPARTGCGAHDLAMAIKACAEGNAAVERALTDCQGEHMGESQ